jgi:hypothetical protein
MWRCGGVEVWGCVEVGGVCRLEVCVGLEVWRFEVCGGVCEVVRLLLIVFSNLHKLTPSPSPHHTHFITTQVIIRCVVETTGRESSDRLIETLTKLGYEMVLTSK